MRPFLHQTGFYIVETLDAEPQCIEAAVRINPAHPLFAGHFPDRPIVPGVCLYQLICEIGILGWKTPLRLAKGNSIKFLHLVTPGQTNVTVSLQATWPTPDTLKVNATLRNAEQVICKANVLFSCIG